MEAKKKKEWPEGLLGGTLNIMGLKIDLEELLESPEGLQGRLEELRERLEAAGGKEILSAEEWRKGGLSVTGHIRTRGLLGEREFHLGTTGPGRAPRAGGKEAAPEAPEVMEPPVDVFDEGPGITVVADVPGVGLEELELKAEGDFFSLATRPGTRRGYRKELRLPAPVEAGSLEAHCRNGVLEVRLRKLGAKETGAAPPQAEKKPGGKKAKP